MQFYQNKKIAAIELLASLHKKQKTKPAGHSKFSSQKCLKGMELIKRQVCTFSMPLKRHEEFIPHRY
jgi:hypothetical protein